MRTGQQQGVLPVEAGVDDGGGGEGGDDVADVLVAGPQAEDETASLLGEPGEGEGEGKGEVSMGARARVRMRVRVEGGQGSG